MTIALAQIEQMFESVRETTDWNIDGPCLWGYFFADESEPRLRAAAAELAAMGYRVVEIFEVDGDDEDEEDEDEDEGEDGDEPGGFMLHVEKVETHSPLSLFRRNEELYAFAERHGLGDYDGMDVGPAPNA
jgi:hypothetical protein